MKDRNGRADRHVTVHILMLNLEFKFKRTSVEKNPTSVPFASDVLHCVVVSSSERTGAQLIHCTGRG